MRAYQAGGTIFDRSAIAPMIAAIPPAIPNAPSMNGRSAVVITGCARMIMPKMIRRAPMMPAPLPHP